MNNFKKQLQILSRTSAFAKVTEDKSVRGPINGGRLPADKRRLFLQVVLVVSI